MKQRIYRAGLSAPRSAHGGMNPAPRFQEGHSGAADVLKAATGAGLVINEILAREYRQNREAEINDAVLEVSRRFELWRNEYEEKNQGKLGINALEDYGRKFDELSREAQAGYGGSGNEIFPKLLSRKLAERGLFAVRDGASFARRQREVWLTSQANAQEEEFMQYAAANPQDSEGIAFKRNQLLETRAKLSPGQDLGAMVAKLDRQTLETRLTALEAQGDYDSMEALLATRKQLHEAGITANSPYGHWAAAYNNPGCVTTNGEDMAMYATPEEGVAAIMERAVSYARQKHDTPTRIMKLYAPEKENDTASYIRYICKATGKGPHEKVDTSDPAFLKAFARAIGQKENSITLSDELLDKGYEYLRQHGKPRFTGSIPRNRPARLALLGSSMTPDQLVCFQKSIEAGRRMQAGKALEGQVLAWSRELENMPKEDQEGAIAEWTKTLPEAQQETARSALYDFLWKRDRQESRGRQIAGTAAEKAEAERENAHIGQMLGLPDPERPRYIEAVAGGSTPEARRLSRTLQTARNERLRLEEEAWRMSWQNTFDSSLNEVQGEAAQEERLTNLVDAYAKNSDDADKMLAYGKRFIERAKRAAKSREAALFQQLAPFAEQGNIPAIRQALAEACARGQITPEGLKRGEDLFFGPAAEENRQNINALHDGRVLISNGYLQSRDERQNYAALHRLTLGQEKDLLAFQGNDADVNYGRIAQAAKIYGMNNISPRQFDILVSRLPKDRKATERDIYELLAIFSQKETAFFGSGATLLKHLDNNDGKLDSFRPRIEDHELPILEAWCKQHGLPVTAHNLELLKLRQLGHKLGIKVDGEFDN